MKHWIRSSLARSLAVLATPLLALGALATMAPASVASAAVTSAGRPLARRRPPRPPCPPLSARRSASPWAPRATPGKPGSPPRTGRRTTSSATRWLCPVGDHGPGRGVGTPHEHRGGLRVPAAGRPVVPDRRADRPPWRGQRRLRLLGGPLRHRRHGRGRGTSGRGYRGGVRVRAAGRQVVPHHQADRRQRGAGRQLRRGGGRVRAGGHDRGRSVRGQPGPRPGRGYRGGLRVPAPGPLLGRRPPS